MIRFLSDLHLEFGLSPLSVYESLPKVKYLVLAGDITTYSTRDRMRHVVDALGPTTEHIVYILGNHEYYDSADHTSVVPAYRKLCAELGIRFLENEAWYADDYTFYGSTMWTNPSPYAFSNMNDRRCFPSLKTIADMHKASKGMQQTFIAAYANPNPLVIINHHLPCFSLIDPMYARYKQLNSGFASDLNELMVPPVKCWAYGHTHTPRTTELSNGIQLICNPHGYPKERSDYMDITWTAYTTEC